MLPGKLASNSLMIHNGSLGYYGDPALGNCKAPFAVFVVIDPDLNSFGNSYILIQDGIVDHRGAFHIDPVHQYRTIYRSERM